MSEQPQGAEPGDERPTPAALTRTERRAVRRLQRRRTWHHRLLWGVAVVVAFVTAVGTVSYLQLDGNIRRIEVLSALGTARPTPTTVEGPDQPVNLLLIGSDDRLGLGTTKYGKDTIEGGAHSDTNLLVHLSADRTWAMVVSIPRDSMVRSPKDCTDPTSNVADGVVRQWNQNFTLGGPSCVIRTLEANTGVFVNHVAVVDFNGFRAMVDALGGVDVCLATAIDDPDSQFALGPGRHHVDGETALGYVRVRKSVGDGSDLGRIRRQQAFLSSLVQQVAASSTLLRPDRLYRFLDAATTSLTTDAELDARTLTTLVRSMSGIGLSRIRFYTVPTEAYARDSNRVQWTAAAAQLWTAIKTDRPPVKAGVPAPTTPARPLTVAPDRISVEVVNDSGVSGLATQAVDALRTQGFTEVASSNGKVGLTGAVIHHSRKQAEAARTVGAAFRGATYRVDERVGSVVTVHLGLDSPMVSEVPNRLGAKPLPIPSVSAVSPERAALTGRSADADICR